MAISAAGIGSGLDVNSLVTQLVNAERAPQAQRIASAQGRINVTLSALGTFKGGLAALQTAVKALTGSGNTIGKLTTSLSAEGIIAATAGSGAVAGRYDVEVLSYAKAHKVATTAYAGGASSVVGNGTVTIGVGGSSFDVTLVDGANTLADLRDRINAATDNTGVTASILTEDAGARLVLTSTGTGTAKALSVSAGLITTEDVQPATDAQIKIDGYTHTSSSNTISTAIQGVTLNLLKSAPGTTVTVEVKPDQTASSEAIQNLVRAYNAVIGVVKKHASYDAATKTGGPLMGDVGVRSAMQALRSVLGGAAGDGNLTTLSQLGITTNTDGTLEVDAAKLSTALTADVDAVKDLFAGTTGFGTRLAGVLDGFVGTEGRIDSETERLQTRLDAFDDQTEALDRRMALVESRYRRQFTALDTLLGQMQTTSSFLTQQLGNLPGAGS